MPIKDYSYNRFATDNGNEEFVFQIIEEIFNEVSKVIDNKWISTLDVPFATEISMYKLYSIVNLSMYPHDGLIQPNNKSLEHFQPDLEPQPSSIDNWARGAGTTSFSSCLLLPLLLTCSLTYFVQFQLVIFQFLKILYSILNRKVKEQEHLQSVQCDLQQLVVQNLHIQVVHYHEMVQHALIIFMIPHQRLLNWMKTVHWVKEMV